MLSSMLASSLLPYFLDTYSLSTSSLGCNALCMVISCSLVHLFKFISGPLQKRPQYLTRGTVKISIPLIRFLLDSLSWFGRSTPLVLSFVTFHYKHGTFSTRHSIPMSWLYILTVLEFSFFFFSNSLMSSIYIRRLFFFGFFFPHKTWFDS